MKKLLIFISLSIFISFPSFAQLIITDNKIDQEDSAILQLNSTTRGFLMPRMTNQQRIDIESPVAGLQVYVTDFNDQKGAAFFFNGNKWKAMTQLITCPGPPTNINAIFKYASNEINITFEAPKSNGGSTITKYTVTDTINAISIIKQGAEIGSITIPGLTDNIFYTFTVTASNNIGSSIPSEPLSLEPNPEVGDLLFGGVVFYIFNPQDTPYYKSGETHGLICALEDLEDKVKWGTIITLNGGVDDKEVGNTQNNMISGSNNTDNIIAKIGTFDTNYAAYRAKNFKSIGVVQNWFLPSKDQLNKLHTMREILNNKFDPSNMFLNNLNDLYWSSSENGKSNAFTQNLDNGNSHGTAKSTKHFVRPIRHF